MKPYPAITENLIDKAIRFVAPVAAQKRMAARIRLGMYDAFSGASDKPALKSWRASRGDADSDINSALSVLRPRSRDLARNTLLGRGIIRTCRDNVVGSGLYLDARIDRDVLGMSDAEAEKWEANTEREFELFADSTECDIERCLNFYGLQELAFTSALINGESFGVLTHIKDRNSPYKLVVNLIEADRCSNPDNKFDTEQLTSGIEKDENGAPVKYHFSSFHPGSLRYFAQKKEWYEVPAYNSLGLRNVIHLFEKERVGQTRGIPYLTPVIEALRQLEQYTNAELMAAVISGMYTVFLKDEDYDDIDDLENPDGKKEDAVSETKMSAGTMVHLGKGKTIENPIPGRPNSGFDPFFNAIVKQIGASLGVPFEIMLKIFQSSYSASQAAMHEAWRFFKHRRMWLATYFIQPIYERWLWEAVALGRISAPGFFADPLRRKAYLGAEWVGPAKGMIDEMKQINAAKTRIETGITTLKEETINLTGGDYKKNLRQRGEELKQMEQYGLRGGEI
ncbi:phage portal protein [Geovibrio ferrireducens]|uniref:phage portal protein n=1 Tax=Geovibrio ferrireducens TaxID=46201 RepID=UPI002247FA51|nr:phage portal protein [Geovibrio ferrireducens]